MTKIYRNHKDIIKSILLEFSFIGLAILFIIYPLYSGHIYRFDDAVFNLDRIKEVIISISHFQLPQFTSYTRYPTGIATMTFYPWLIFAPLVIFKPLLKYPVELWYLIIGIGMLTGLNVAYFASKTLFKPKKEAFLFSVLYCWSSLMVGNVLYNCDIGSYLAVIFSPLAFFGWFAYRRNNHWKMMVVGLILMMSCHIPSTLIMLASLILITFFDRNAFSKKQLLTGLKALAIFILISVCLWLPIIVLLSYNNIQLPNAMGTSSIHNIIPTVHMLTHPFLMRLWDYIDLISLALSILFWKKLPAVFKIITVYAIFCILIGSPTFWRLFANEVFINHFQYALRFNFVISLILLLDLSYILFKILPKYHFWNLRNLKALMIGLIAIILSASLVSEVELNTVSKNYLKNQYRELNMLHTKNLATPVLNNHNLNYNRLVTTDASVNDYYPKNMVKHYIKWEVFSAPFYTLKRKYRMYYNKKEKKEYGKKVRMAENTIKGYDQIAPPKLNVQYPYIHKTYWLATGHKINRINNGASFYMKHKESYVLIPIALYKAQDYQITENGKPVKYYKENGSVIIPTIKHGRNIIRFKTPIMWYRYLAMLISLIGLIWLIMAKEKNASKNN